MPNQPIGYIDPAEGEHLALGLRCPIGSEWEPPARSLSAAVTGGAQLSPQPYTGPGSGEVFNGFGRAQFPRLFAPLIGLNCT